mmetsp:Transcript_24983/g.71181  ORF Transcript_24983/g.71181 Transcript_24983/m.71181 type:complete len:322 (+) Transcript_24983:789-1754(+)
MKWPTSQSEQCKQFSCRAQRDKPALSISGVSAGGWRVGVGSVRWRCWRPSRWHLANSTSKKCPTPQRAQRKQLSCSLQNARPSSSNSGVSSSGARAGAGSARCRCWRPSRWQLADAKSWKCPAPQREQCKQLIPCSLQTTMPAASNSNVNSTGARAANASRCKCALPRRCTSAASRERKGPASQSSQMSSPAVPRAWTPSSAQRMPRASSSGGTSTGTAGAAVAAETVDVDVGGKSFFWWRRDCRWLLTTCRSRIGPLLQRAHHNPSCFRTTPFSTQPGCNDKDDSISSTAASPAAPSGNALGKGSSAPWSKRAKYASSAA